jgi:hypothetical protein
MKKLISLFTLIALLSFSGLVSAQTQDGNKQTRNVKKTEQTRKAVKKVKKDCGACPDKAKCSAKEKAADKK